MLLNEDPVKLHVFLDRLNISLRTFGMRFAPSKCKMMSQDWIESKANVVLAMEKPGEVDSFGSGILLGSRISENFQNAYSRLD